MIQSFFFFFFFFDLQEAFFGKGILDQTKETTKDLLKQESDSDGEQSSPAKPLPVSGEIILMLLVSE